MITMFLVQQQQQSGTTELENYAYRKSRSDIYKEAAKRKKLDDNSLLPDEEDMQLDDDDHHEGGEDVKGETTPPGIGLNGSVDEEDDLSGSHFEQQELGSQNMEVSIQHIRQKMDLFTQQVGFFFFNVYDQSPRVDVRN